MGKKNKNKTFGRVKRKHVFNIAKKKKGTLDKIHKRDTSSLPTEMDSTSPVPNQQLLSGIENESPEKTRTHMDISVTNDSIQSIMDSSFIDSEIDVTIENSTEADSETEFNLTIENNDTSETEIPLAIEGRRVVDMQYFLDQIIEISKHSNKFGCQLEFIKVIKENSHGLKSTFSLRCDMCYARFNLHTEDTNKNVIDVNHSAVSGTILMGCGSSNLKEFTASMNLPTINQNIYDQCHEDLHDWWKEAADKAINDAALEECQEANEKSATGKPMIAVTADACWGKRSYRTNYSSLSGVGAIIGINSGKVLHVGIKNKYCVKCARASNKDTTPPEHKCTINHKGSSTSMEQTAIVEGFKESEEKHGLIYSKLIADGDASTYKNILESRPYTNVIVQKIECSNHLMRNYNGKNLNLAKDTAIPLTQRKLLNPERINRLRVAVKQAVRYRSAQNFPLSEQIKNLRRDILNSPNHVFGDHSNCEDYYCSPEKKLQRNYVPEIPALMKKIMTNTTNLASHSQSLLYRQNNNRAEQFNALVAKYVGGKRVNYALKKSYTLRCYAAVVAFNTGMPIYMLHKTITGSSPSKITKRVEERKRANNTRKKTWKPKRQILFSKDLSTDYGESCQKPDMTLDEYQIRKTQYLNGLKEQLKEKDSIERETTEQSESALWLELRRCLLTASNFAKVCKRRSNISPAPLVKAMLYSYSLDHVPAIQHGKKNEGEALQQLANQENITVVKCGLHIDPKFYFLGATPDGLYEEGIIEIKCPKSAFGMDPEEAIKMKKINVWKVVNGDTVLNKNHDWYYQVQGQLHIANKTKCLFAVWTGPDYRLKTELIEKDDNFWAMKMEVKLINFYEKCLLPEIVDPRKSRSMPLRDDPF